MKDVKQFIGQTFKVQGLCETRTVRIKSIYNFGNYGNAFHCIVKGNYKHFKDGDRENFLCSHVIKNKKLIDIINVLTA